MFQAARTNKPRSQFRDSYKFHRRNTTVGRKVGAGAFYKAMATGETAAPVAAPVSQGGSQPAQLPANPAATAPTNAPQLTPAQLKAKAKAEKAARRAQAKEVKAAVAVAVTPSQAGATASDAKGSKAKGKQEGSLGAGQQPHGKPSGGARRPSITGRRPSAVAVEKDIRSSIPECFSHVPMAKRIPLSQAHKDVHPAVLAVGQQMATFAIKDSIARLEASLLAFKKVGNFASM